jgi:hypothetical protein
MGLSLALGAQRSGGGAAFGVSLTGLTNGEAIIGDHASIGYTTDPVSATETVKWSSSADPAAAATYGTGASPTDYTAGDEGRLYLHVTDGGETVTRSALIRYARGTAPAVADGQAWTVDDTSVNIDGSASGANLTFTYAIGGLPAGVAINASTGAITGTPTAVASGTATITATDQYGLAYSDTFTWANTLRAQATAAGGLGPFSFAQDSAISSTDLSADFTAGGNTLTFTISPALPAGLSLASNGILSGTPTTLQSATSYTVTGQDEYGRDTDSTFTIAVTDIVVKAEGGSEYSSGGNRVHVFRTSDTLTVLETVTVSGISIGGGGSGGNNRNTNAGGGGAGEVQKFTSVSLTPGDYVITIGSGGLSIAQSGSAGINGNPGGTTTVRKSAAAVSGIADAIGGGFGGGVGNGGDGGSGGGGGSQIGVGGSATGTGLGNAGGDSDSGAYFAYGPGGGGAGSVGVSGVDVGSAPSADLSHGGDGVASDIPGADGTNAPTRVGGGGGGSIQDASYISGAGAAVDGGGVGGINTTGDGTAAVRDAGDGVDGTGGGGGASVRRSDATLTENRSGAGGDGLFAVWYTE